jgi:streptogramin lyase
MAMDAAGALAIPASPDPDWVSIAGGTAWVANVGGGIRRYDVTSGAELGTVPVPGAICLAMDVGFDSLWAGDCDNNTVVRVDVATGQVLSTIEPGIGPLAAEASIAVDDKGVYVMSEGVERKVARIDPATNTVANVFAAPSGASALRAGFGSLWFSQSGQGTLTRVDPASGSMLGTVAAGKGAGFLAVGEGSVWVLNNFVGTVTRVGSDGAPVATITVDEGLVEGGDIAVGGGFVWARVTSSVVVQIDAATNKVVGRFGEPSGSGSVAADDGGAWISAHDVDTVWRLPIH